MHPLRAAFGLAVPCPGPAKVPALKKFQTSGLTTGQSYRRELRYSPLPAEVASLSLAALDRIN